ncbi:MAG TPA: glycosyl hydrolase family 79 C-terminal domain-containing protein [Solirubrobacteraceae bacterium]|nr:glycosyl hydrolase family 79 C-terminal domain-containing protein [Solirubrobacteraceae bacterium]
MSRTARRVLLAAAVALVGAAVVVALVSGGGRAKHHKRATVARASPPVMVDPGTQGATIEPGFLGLSIEYWAVEAYAGKNPAAVNPVLTQLIRNLTPGQTEVLRIGGVSTDQTWWAAAGVKRPPGVFYKLNEQRLKVMQQLAAQTGARLILGITFEADSPVLAGAEARAMVAAIGSSRIDAFELGNEPELYGNPAFAWYRQDGHNVMGRPDGYDAAQFAQDFATVAAGMSGVPLAGPASGAADWLDDLGPFIAGNPRLSVVTVHRYPFEACAVPPSSPSYPTVSRMLSPLGTTDQAGGLAPYVAVAHAHGLPLRIGEMNDVGCGNPPYVPNSFAEALWAIDALFAYAQVGVDGVNVHTWPGAVYNLFTFQKTETGWEGSVEPEYYGLLMFAQAAPPGSRLVKTSSRNPAVRAWATRAADGTVRVMLINDDTAAAQRLSVDVAGATGAATLERLLAPSPTATSGVTLGGQTFGETRTGELAGPVVQTTISPSNTGYSVSLPPASAALLILR